jgi:hypothetical protein
MNSNGHFEREAKLNLWFVLLLFGIPLLATIVGAAIFQQVDAFRADRCLDQGGSYNYEAGECDFQKSHPGP